MLTRNASGAAALLAVIFLAGAAAQPQTSLDPNAIMGFETPAGWLVKSDVFSITETSTTIRTQGNYALAIKDGFLLTTLTSMPVASTATALAGLGNTGATFEVDVLPPTLKPNDFVDRFQGTMELLVSSPSNHIYNELLGSINFAKLRPGTYNTVSYPIPSRVQNLAGTAFTDLTFTFALTFQLSAGNTYLFDNLRVHSAQVVTTTTGTQAPPGYGGSVDLVVTGGNGSPGSPVTSTFPIGPIQVPQGFHLTAGTARAGTSVQLELGLDGTPSFTCTYNPDPSDATAASYIFSSCSVGFRPGDLASANWVSLGIVNGDSSMNISAQLAANPLGDTLGSGLLPPMPTFWGDFDTCVPAPQPGTFITTSPSCTDQLAQANQIVTNYFNQVQEANVGSVWIVTPKPTYANHPPTVPLPVNLLPGGGGGSSGGATTIPFNYSGHINPGGSFDAYWEVSGDVGDSLPLGTDAATSSVDARFGTHVVMFGDDADVFDIEGAITTTTAESYPVPTGPVATGTITSYIGGEQFPTDCCSFNIGTVNLNYNHDFDIDLPPLQIWIFQITAGLDINGGFTLVGDVQPNNLNVTLTPEVGVGVHLQGSVSIIVASGGIDAKVFLAQVQAPFAANLGWTFDEDPGTCAATTSGDFNGQLTLSSGGGEVDLVATFGFCPICHDVSYPIFSWGPIASESWTLFNDPLTGTHPLPAPLCTKGLTVQIASPPATGATALAGVPVGLAGGATLPSSNPNNGPSGVPCSDLTWTFTSGAASLAPVTGCNPEVTFPAPAGTSAVWTINLSASESFTNSGGTITDTGSATPVQITVSNPVSGSVFITQLTDSSNNVYSFCTPTCEQPVYILPNTTVTQTYTIQGQVTGGSGTLATTFTVTNSSNNTTTTLTAINGASSTPSAVWTVPAPVTLGTYTIAMTTTSNGNPLGSTTAIVYLTEIF